MTYPPFVAELIESVEAKVEAGLRACMKCGDHKKPAEFYKNDLYRDGFSTRCRTCHRGYEKVRRQDLKPKKRGG